MAMGGLAYHVLNRAVGRGKLFVRPITDSRPLFRTPFSEPAGVEIENTGTEPLVGLRCFGPDVHAKVPSVGDYRN